MTAFNSLHLLFGNAIDYAGIFPPASLTLEAAVEEYAHFRKQSSFPWLMGRFTLPLPSLKKISEAFLYESGADGSPWIFTALSSSLPDQASTSEALRIVQDDLRSIQEFNRIGKSSAILYGIGAYEMKLSDNWIQKTSEQDLVQLLELSFKTSMDLYLEITLGKSWVEGLEKGASCLAKLRLKYPTSLPGLKIRTGGDKIPTAAEFAKAIWTGKKGNFRFKATQGLHSAYSHGNNFGFINYLVGVALAYQKDLPDFSIEDLEKVLCLSSPDAIELSKGGVRIDRFTLNKDQIGKAQKIHRSVFGSCSLVEPEAELKLLLK